MSGVITEYPCSWLNQTSWRFFFSFFLFLEIELCLHVGGRIEVEGPPLGGLGDQAGIVNLGGGNQRKTV